LLTDKATLSIIQAHSHDYGGGAEVVVRLNHRALNHLGHRSQLIVGRKKSEDVDIELLKYRRGVPGSRRVAKAIESLVGLQYTYSPSFRSLSSEFKLKPDVVHLHALHGAGGWADLWGFSTLKRKFPTVCSLQDLWWLTGHCAYGMECERWQTGCGKCPDLKRYPAVARDATRLNWHRKKRVLSGSDIQFIAPSEWVKAQCAKSPVIGKNPVHVVPNPIDTAVFRPGDKSAAREKFGIPAGASVVLVAANHLDSHFKGAGDAIYVLNKLDCKNAFALIVGRGSEQVAKCISLRSNSLGYIDDGMVMAECYQAADVFVVPSRVETFGLVAAEAVACGAVVVSYQAGGLQEVTKLGEGVVVEDGDRDGLLAATSQLLSLPEERAHRLAQGQPRVMQMCSPVAHAEACISVYRSAISGWLK